MKATTALLPFLLPAFGAAIKLSDFAALPSSVTSNSCKSTYNSDISNCQNSDFADGANCSPDCITGLIIKGKQIQTDCLGAVTGEDSLLNYAFHSQLAPAVCKNVVGSGGSGGSAPDPGTSASIQTDMPSSSTTSAPSKSSSTPSSTMSTSTTSPSSSTTARSTMQVSTDAGPSPTSGPSGFKTTAVISSASTTPLASYTKPAQAQGGGGSPFQFAGAGSALQVSQWGLAWTSALLVLVLSS